MLKRGFTRIVWLLKPTMPSAGAGAAAQVPTQRLLLSITILAFLWSLLPVPATAAAPYRQRPQSRPLGTEPVQPSAGVVDRSDLRTNDIRSQRFGLHKSSIFEPFARYAEAKRERLMRCARHGNSVRWHMDQLTEHARVRQQRLRALSEPPAAWQAAP